VISKGEFNNVILMGSRKNSKCKLFLLYFIKSNRNFYDKSLSDLKKVVRSHEKTYFNHINLLPTSLGTCANSSGPERLERGVDPADC
jgi:hypothetical protein